MLPILFTSLDFGYKCEFIAAKVIGHGDEKRQHNVYQKVVKPHRNKQGIEDLVDDDSHGPGGMEFKPLTAEASGPIPPVDVLVQQEVDLDRKHHIDKSGENLVDMQDLHLEGQGPYTRHKNQPTHERKAHKPKSDKI